MSPITIQSITLVNNQITVLFDQHWFQENITTLRHLLLNNISSLCIKEMVIGADLENVRFQWLDTEFIVNFDYYSQSCWFETQGHDNLAETLALFNLLTQNNNNHV
ncbi:MAG: hypothetical protein COB45_11495 [Gammaproteobacteria bacterium]|nr:MAG: hypothetical protein COB45_11495 [Gammaproteobacteria bacterium]PHR83674.1 MAG: hypothetical protein COA59_11320 [Colwellia sp.]